MHADIFGKDLEAASTRRRDGQHHLEGERTRAHRERRTLDAATLHSSQRSRSAGAAVRLWSWPVWGVHGHHQRRRGALVRDADLERQRRNHHARGAGAGRQAASAAAGVDRGAGAAVRLLPERPDHDGEGNARQEPAPDRRADSRRHVADAVPLHDVLPHSGRHQARRGRECMNIEKILLGNSASPSRRDFLKTSGMLVVGFSAAAVAGPLAAQAGAQAARGLYPDPDFRQLDSWIVIHQDSTATFYVGKTDCGQGTGTAFRQMMSDELDIPFKDTTCVMGTTDITVDQGGSGGSDAIQVDGWPMRRVAAEARRVLLDMASQRFAVPAAGLAVADAVITVKADPSKRITYGELIGGKRFNVALTGANIDATTGIAKVKPVQELKMVGQSPQRYDIPPKVTGSAKWAADVKVPGMVHARNVKPPFAGAKLMSIDESSVRNLPGFVKVVSKGNYVAVVCEREEQAIAAARQLKCNWQKPATAPFPASAELFTYMRGTSPKSSQTPNTIGNVDTAFTGAAKIVEAEYEIPFQGHTAISPAHAVADPSNGQMTIYSNDMKSYGMRNGVATFLGVPREQVRVIWMEGPQGYGRTAADDAGFEAAYIAKEIGRPVRMQWTRAEEQGWDTKGPAFTFKIRGALDAQGNMTGLDYAARSCDYNHLGYNEPDTVLIAQLMGQRRAMPANGSSAFPNDMYAIPNRRTLLEVVGLPLIWETPIRTGRSRRLRPNRSSTRWPRRRRLIRSSSACGCSRPATPTTTASGGPDRSPCSRPRPRSSAGSRGLRRTARAAT